MSKKRNAAEIKNMKFRGEKISMITCYDFSFARIIDKTAIDVILVGDSGGMVSGGAESTIPVTMDEMIYHTRSVRRGSSKFIVADMPFMSYHAAMAEGIRNAGRFLKEAGADAVKVEGGEPFAPFIRRLTESSIPVVGHLGLMPQSVLMTGGYRLQGKDPQDAERIVADAKMIEAAGAFALVLELVPEELAARVAKEISIPVIGIGAGRKCDGQVLVINDMLGFDPSFNPKFLKKYANLYDVIHASVESYSDEVKSGAFPAEENSF